MKPRHATTTRATSPKRRPRAKHAQPQQILDWFAENPGSLLTYREFFDRFGISSKTYATEVLRGLAEDGIERVLVIRRKP